MPESESATFVKQPPTIRIDDRVAVLHFPGEQDVADCAMSIRNLGRLGERIQRALKRNAAGDQNIIVDD